MSVWCPAPVWSLRLQAVDEVEANRVQVALNRRRRKPERAGEVELIPVQLVPERRKSNLKQVV